MCVTRLQIVRVKNSFFIKVDYKGKVDPKSRKVVATIQCGVPGGGGEISAGGGAVWLTVFQLPLTRIDAKTDKVTHQWTGAGGDAVLFAHGSVWLSNLREQNIWRLDPAKLLK